MARDRKEYMKKYHETHKEERKEYMKKYYEDHKEERKEKAKKYHETHKDYHKKYYETHKEHIRKLRKKYMNKHKEQNKNYYYAHKEERKEQMKKWREKYSKYLRYFHRNYSRFISLKNYITIMKLGDSSLKQSIMVKLGKGTILEDEAVALSSMVWTKEDQKELDDYWKISKNKRSSSKS